LWVIGVEVLIPSIVGLGPFPAGPADQLVSLAAFLIYGVITAYLTEALSAPRERTTARRRGLLVNTSLVLLVLSVVSALFMLRSAQTTSPQALEVAPGYRVPEG